MPFQTTSQSRLQSIQISCDLQLTHLVSIWMFKSRSRHEVETGPHCYSLRMYSWSLQFPFESENMFPGFVFAILPGTQTTGHFLEKNPNTNLCWSSVHTEVQFAQQKSAFRCPHILKRVDEAHGPWLNVTYTERKGKKNILTGREQQFWCVWALVSDRDNDETQTKTH